jgi:hypothetical protein
MWHLPVSFFNKQTLISRVCVPHVRGWGAQEMLALSALELFVQGWLAFPVQMTA